MMKQGFPEILAPAGSMESLYAALHAQADAVYFGGKVLSARAYAGNFGREEVIEAVALAHQHNAKAYYTLNTLIKNHELKLLEDIGNTVVKAGVDAMIIQDMGAYLFFKRYFPEVELHASTQMTVHSIAGAQRLHDLRFERVVLSRELNLKEVRQIIEAVPIEVETFVHGAMCYCYSGQCQMSAAYGERSANRGKCAQPCRLPYTVGKKQGYLLSLKDQMTLEHLPQIIESGIHSLKIEGRMKNPEYVYTIASMYRKYRDLALSGKNYQVDSQDIARMNEVFARGQTSEGYYSIRKSGEMIFPEQPKTAKLTNSKTLAELSFVRNKPELKQQIGLYMTIKAEEPAMLRVDLMGTQLSVTEYGNPVQKADKKAVSQDDIRKPVCQVGDTGFEVGEVRIDCQDGLFLPMSQVKELRRNALSKLSELVSAQMPEASDDINEKERNIQLPEQEDRQKHEKPLISVLVRTTEQLKQVAASAADIIYLEWSFIKAEDIISQIGQLLEVLTGKPKKLYLAVPTTLRNDESKLFLRELEEIRRALNGFGLTLGVLARTADYLDIFRRDGYEIMMDHSMNIWNSLSYQFYSEHDKPEQISLGNEISYLSRSNIGQFEMVVYAKLATMHTANCLANVNSAIPKKLANPMCKVGAVQTLDYITDRKGNQIGYHRNCKSCSNTLFNPVPLFLADQDVSYARCLRFELLDESAQEIAKLIAIISKLKQGESEIVNPLTKFTRGHYSKGVE